MKKLFSLLAILLCLNSIAQTNLDSLHQVWLDESQPDTIRLNAFYNYIWDGYLFSQPDKAFILAEQLMKKAVEKNITKWHVSAINIQGISYAFRGNSHDALERYYHALEIQKEQGDEEGMASTFNNIGLTHKEMGNMSEALECFKQSLEIHEKYGKIKTSANPLNNIGLVYRHQGKNLEALEYYSRSFKIHEQFGNSRGMANTTMNMGVIYYKLERVSEAIDQYNQSLKLFTELSDKWGMGSACMNLGETHSGEQNYEEALKYFNQSLEIEKGTGDKDGEASSLNGIARVYKGIGKLEEAYFHAKRSIELSLETGSVTGIKYSSRTLKEIYKAQNKGMEALEMYELEVQMDDSIKSEEAKKGILKMEVQHDFEKQQLIAEQEAQEQERHDAEKVSRRNSIQYSGIGLGIFALFGLVFLFGRIKLPNWAVELSVFLPFLILFEFLLVVSDSYLDTWSGGEPLIKLGLNVLLAGAIFPLHSFFEKFLKKRLFKSS